MNTNHHLSWFVTTVYCLVLSVGGCGDDAADSSSEDPNAQTNTGDDDDDDTGSGDNGTDTGETDGTEPESTGDGEGTDTTGDTGLSASVGDDVPEETTQALAGTVSVATYVDETVPIDVVTEALFKFDGGWNQVTPTFCDQLGNRVSCPAITCDAEAREATLSYESSFDGCEVTGCFFASKTVSGSVSISRADEEDAVVLAFDAFTIGDFTFDGAVEVQSDNGVKQVAFSGEDSTECPGLHITGSADYEACISGELSVAKGDDPGTTDVEEKRTVEMVDLAFQSEHYDVVLNGTLVWLEGVDCLGPQKGTVTVSLESKAKDDEDNPLLALSFDVVFDPANRSEIQTLIQGSQVFGEYETILPRGVFCSLPKLDSLAFSHGAIEDFQEAEFVKRVVNEIIEQVTQRVLDTPKAQAVRALTQGLTADDMLARLSEVGEGKLVRFIQAPVKGLCRLEDTATCPAITVGCADPGDGTGEPTFFECNDVTSATSGESQGTRCPNP